LVESGCIVQIRACERVGGRCVGCEPGEDAQGVEEPHDVVRGSDGSAVFDEMEVDDFVIFIFPTLDPVNRAIEILPTPTALQWAFSM
jgi:hypothetical protein